MLIELDGVRLLTDPLLRNRVAHLRRVAPLEGVPAADAVLTSHGHYDHLDLPSLRLLQTSRVVVPSALAPCFADLPILGVAEGDEVSIGPLTVRATHAEHEGGRPAGRPAGRPGLALGYAIL